MRRPRRIRRIFKWASACGCVLVVAAWSLNLYRFVQLNLPFHRIWLAFDCLSIHYSRLPNSSLEFDGWLEFDEYPHYHNPIPPKFYSHRWGFSVVIPFWLMIVAFGMVTGALFWLDTRSRQTPKGHCRKCGYNLTGNASGICPECGTKI